MKKSITFEHLKQILKEGTGRKWGDIKRELIGERNDEKPVTPADLPYKLMEYLKTRLNATIHKNEMPLPYLYVDIPLHPGISRGGKRLTTGVLNELERKVAAAKWNIIEKFDADDFNPYPEDVVDEQAIYTILISPYSNPHSLPGIRPLGRPVPCAVC